MPVQSRVVFCTAIIVLIILGCITTGCSSDKTPVTPAARAATTGVNTITIKNFAFDPSTLTVKTGTVVTWVNNDGASHTILSDTGSLQPFSSDSLSSGDTFAFTFTRPGTYAYHCSIHPSMKGEIIVQ